MLLARNLLCVKLFYTGILFARSPARVRLSGAAGFISTFRYVSHLGIIMKIFDFRLRPPYKGFTRLGLYNPPCNEGLPQKYHGRPSEAARQKSMDLFWKEMEEAGICGGVVIGRQVPNDAASISNDDIHDMALEYPDRIIPFGSLDVSRGVARTMDELERCIEWGFRGMALEPAYCEPPRFADANVLYPIYARLEKAGIPVLLTMSFFQGNLDYSNPAAAQRVAEDFPNLQIILAHACYPWIPMVMNIPIVTPNIWLLPDLYLLNPDAPGSDMYGQALRWLNGEHVLYGSAYPCYNLKQGIEDVERFQLSDEIKEKFFHSNAEKLLGITI